MHIDPSHPRAISLMIREKLVWGLKKGLTSQSGLLAHGRGEAFDYLLGEKTHEFARRAIEASAALLILAEKPIISTNGNSSSLVANDLIRLAKLLNSKIEVNLFHYLDKRQKAIESYFDHLSPGIVLKSDKNKTVLPNIVSHRKYVIRNGIAAADVVLVPLEDGDRAEALIGKGKKVITIDLNPMSRTAKSASVTIIDNIVRTMPLLCQMVRNLKKKPRKNLEEIIKEYNNASSLSSAMKTISKNLTITY